MTAPVTARTAGQGHMGDDQSATIAFLALPSTHGGLVPDRVDTHTAIVFLAGSRVLKLKRAVRFDYVDFSTVERRRRCCEAEVRLNRRTAPSLYRGVIAVTRDASGRLALQGLGEVVDWLVEMERFDSGALLDELALRGTLDPALMPVLGRHIAAFHATAEVRRDHGGAAAMAWVVDGNAAGLREFGAGTLDLLAVERLTAASRSRLEQLRPLLEIRRNTGWVRQCHGDLHLGNIVLLEGRPTLFDAIEFNDAIACVDVLYDLAFVLMDLWHRGLQRHANLVWNAYLDESMHLGGVASMPLFLSCRAAIRAKTAATAAHLQPDAARAADQRQRAVAYLATADAMLTTVPPRLIAIGGLSGSGKSTLAVALADGIGQAPGAVVLRSDELRKRLCGVSPLTRLGAEGYRPEVTARVYAALLERARQLLADGQSVILDAVYADPADREAVVRLGEALRVPVRGLWLVAPPATLMARVQGRRGDASDADVAIVRQQLAHGVGDVSWTQLDATGPPAIVLGQAQAAVTISG